MPITHIETLSVPSLTENLSVDSTNFPWSVTASSRPLQRYFVNNVITNAGPIRTHVPLTWFVGDDRNSNTLGDYPMDSNLFIDTQSVHFTETMDIFNRIQVFCLSTYREEQNQLAYQMAERGYAYHSVWARHYDARVATVKARFKNSLASKNHVSHRFAINAYNYKPMKRFLQELSIAVKKEESDDVCEALNNIAGWNVSFATDIYRQLDRDHSFDIYTCKNCGTFMRDDWSHNVDDEIICNRCIRDYYVYSECQNTYIHCDYARSVYTCLRSWRNGGADDCCSERYGNLNFHEYDGGYFSDEDDWYEACSENGYLDDEDEDEDRDDYDERPRNESHLAGWHGTARNFVEKNASQAYPALGAELEVYIPNRDPFVGVTRPLFESDLILESDGSLCSHHGIEMISHPLGREEWDEFAPRWLKHVQDYGGLGYNEPAGDRYGIHLTIHRKNFSPLAEARIAMFLSSTDNAQFVRAVAQRNQIYAADNGLGIGRMMRPQLSVVSPNGFDERYNDRNGRTEMKMRGRGKFCPVNFKGDLAEFRIFQSTTNIVSFQKNLEFVWALWAWTKTETASGNSHNYKDFVLWLNKRQQRKQFPTLIKFLSKKVFYGANFPPITSPWHSLMTHPTEDYAVEDMAA